LSGALYLVGWERKARKEVQSIKMRAVFCSTRANMSLLCWLVKPTSTSGGQLDSHTSRVSTDEPQTESQTASSASLAGVNALQPVSS